MTTGLDVGVLRTGAVLVPVLIGAVLWLLNPEPRARGAAVLATLWNAVFLVPLNVIALHQHWWSFGAEGALWHGVPVDLVLAWAVLWGATPVLLSRWLNPMAMGAALMVWDVLMMGSLGPLVVLNARWWIGEVAAAAICLAPGIALGWLTVSRRRLRVRAGLQMVLFGTLLLVALPAIALSVDSRAALPQRWDSATVLTLIQCIVVVGVLALQSVAEFVRHGGTPYPWDPPDRLATTGPYAFVANPMQLTSVTILLLVAAVVRSPVLVLAAVVGAAFSAGIAAWSERQDLRDRFGGRWVEYRTEVRDWLPRSRPTRYRQRAELYVAESCGPCTEVRRWLLARGPVALDIRPAEEHDDALRRVQYQAQDGLTLTGTRAIGAALEHLGMGWAVLGWIMRAPLISWLVQLAADASGAGPRTVPRSR